LDRAHFDPWLSSAVQETKRTDSSFPTHTSPDDEDISSFQNGVFGKNYDKGQNTK
jgi:hypothetical protein